MQFKPAEKTYKIVEIFKSIEGEGIRTGVPTVFVRFGKCNLQCSWCDTNYAQSVNEWKTMTREKIATQILFMNCTNVTFTGGEPLEEGLDFIKWFADNYEDFDINIETNGSMPIKEFLSYSNVTITMDYKCFSSGMSQKMDSANLGKLRSRDVLKFVVADDKDLDQVLQVVMEHHPKCYIYLSPVFGQMDLQKLAQFVIDHHFLNLRMGLQIHKIIWDPSTRGV